MQRLNLPPINPRLKQEDDKTLILDPIRRKYVTLTPEEWVRQHFISYLTEALHYPKSLVGVERGLTYNALHKRYDILVHDRAGRPWMLVECKSYLVKLTQRSFNQALIYNMLVEASYLTITNGMAHYCWHKSDAKAQPTFLSQLPSFED